MTDLSPQLPNSSEVWKVWFILSLSKFGIIPVGIPNDFQEVGHTRVGINYLKNGHQILWYAQSQILLLSGPF